MDRRGHDWPLWSWRAVVVIRHCHDGPSWSSVVVMTGCRGHPSWSWWAVVDSVVPYMQVSSATSLIFMMNMQYGPSWLQWSVTLSVTVEQVSFATSLIFMTIMQDGPSWLRWSVTLSVTAEISNRVIVKFLNFLLFLDGTNLFTRGIDIQAVNVVCVSLRASWLLYNTKYFILFLMKFEP